MGRFLIPVLLGVGLGGLFGWIQSKAIYRDFEERFTISQANLAVTKGEMTRAEVEAQAVGIPKVEVEGGAKFDFGTMLLGQSMSHEFKFRNVGDGPLFLDMGGSTCKCTIGDLNKSVLKPGDETMVKLTWTPKAAEAGFSQSARIITSDPVNTEVQLIVTGNVAQSIMFDPLNLDLGDISSSETTTRNVRIYCYLDNLELTEARWSDVSMQKFFNFAYTLLDPKELPAGSTAKKAYDLTVKITPGVRLGDLSGRIQVITNQNENVDPIELAVSGRVSGDLEIIGGPAFNRQHNILTMGTIDPAEGASMRLQLALQGEARDAVPKIFSVTPSDVVQVEIGEPKETSSRRLYPVVFRIPKDAPEVVYTGANSKNFVKVVIKTSEDSAEYPIFLRLVVKKP